MRGKAIVLVFVSIIAVAALVMVAYKWQESDAPLSMTFDRVDPDGNVTIHELSYASIHNSGTMLEEHLDYASHWGGSRESVRLRIEAMVQQLESLTGAEGPEWWVRWDGTLLRVAVVTS